jgi:hypothetical protein
MATLETQYKRFLHENPDSKFTYLEWLEWFSNKVAENVETKLNKTKTKQNDTK